MDNKELEKIGLQNGCRPIFYVEITAHWRKLISSKKFEPSVTIKMSYKGLLPFKFNEKLKREFFKKATGSVPVGVPFDTLSVVTCKALHHQGYEVSPNI